MLDVEAFLSELERVLVNLTKLAAEGGGQIEENQEFGLDDDFKVTASVRIGFLDDMLSALAPRPSLEREPMIDVMQTKEGLKVLVLLPGVEKEDIKVFSRHRLLVFEINTRGRFYRKEIPCDLQPSNVSIKSIVENNSVVEITFARKRQVVRR